MVGRLIDDLERPQPAERLNRLARSCSLTQHPGVQSVRRLRGGKLGSATAVLRHENNTIIVEIGGETLAVVVSSPEQIAPVVQIIKIRWRVPGAPKLEHRKPKKWPVSAVATHTEAPTLV